MTLQTLSDTTCSLQQRAYPFILPGVPVASTCMVQWIKRCGLVACNVIYKIRSRAEYREYVEPGVEAKSRICARAHARNRR